MTHFTIREWGSIAIDGGVDGLTDGQAVALLAAARAHPCARSHGSNILIDRRDRLIAGQVVGVIAAKGCSLEILPKIDPDAADEAAVTVRGRLTHMLDVAYNLGLSQGATHAMARQKDSLLDIILHAFAERLLAEVRRGLPRAYAHQEDDLAALRGRMNVQRQFTVHAVRPDRLACRFDELSPDTPLMRVMAGAVAYLTPFARAAETQRKMLELRHRLTDVPALPPARLPWAAVRFDRTNQRWEGVFRLAQMLLRNEWQAVHSAAKAPDGITFLFPMNDLFEAYIAALLRRALAGLGIEVVAQGGHRYCLGAWVEDAPTQANAFQTKPDICLKRGNETLAILDTKWKALPTDPLATGPLDRKRGVGQADVYQMMAYARLYQCDRLMLLYPALSAKDVSAPHLFGLAQGPECLSIAHIALAEDKAQIIAALRTLCAPLLKEAIAA